jgi:glycosyltransferase involved in cell wall biosynthesis
MRVAFVDQQGDVPGGAEQSLAILLGALPGDIEPHVILFGDGHYAETLRARGLPVSIVRMPAAFLSTKRENPLTGLAAIPGALSAVATTLRNVRPDVIHTNTIKAHAVALPVARASGTPSVAHLRDILSSRARLAIRTIVAACSTERIAIARAVSAAFALPLTSIVHNPLVLNDYAQLPTREEARASLGLPAHVALVSIVGRINRWKGHDRLLRVARAMRDRPDLHFAIIGAPVFRDADYADELRAFVAAEELADRVHFVPWLDDVRVAYAASDVVANCSDDEPFGRTLIEAAACGVPSVAFASGGTADAIDDGVTGRLITPGNEAAFAQAIAAFVDDHEMCRRTSHAARSFAQTFEASIHAEHVAAVLRRVGRSGRSGARPLRR